MTVIASIPETEVAAKLHVPVTFAPYTRNAFILQPGSIVEVVGWMGDALIVRFAGRAGGDTQPEGGPMAGRPGRPAVGTKVAVRIPDDVLVVVDKLAADAGTNRSAWIRDAVAAATTRKDSTR